MPEFRNNFNAAQVELVQQSQGVEASAGTGKTYSIALLAVRLLLKTDVQINQILMVTFTRAAVAELQLRVRAFVRKALRIARDPLADIGNDDLKALVNDALDAGQTRNQVMKKLEQASILLEDLPVFTIHGFCGRLLQEYAFETLQAFDSELMSGSESDRLTREFFHEFWRKQVAVMPVEVLFKLMDLGSRGKYGSSFREITFGLVKAGLGGRPPYSPANSGKLENASESIARLEQIKAEIISFLQNNVEDVLRAAGNRGGADFKEHLRKEEFAEALELIIAEMSRPNPAQFMCRVTDIIGNWNLFEEIRDRLAEDVAILAAHIASTAFRYVSGRLQQARQSMAATTFDEMILQVRKAVESPEHLDRLRSELRVRYHAVFIDEFQDTDINQYVIFSKLFGQDHFLYYIGDPKQSIYAFRKADIHTYLQAMADVAILHQMNVNYRSNNDYIEAMNRFFKPNPDFNTFALPGNEIQYHLVEAPAGNNKPVLYAGGNKVCPILISQHEAKDFEPLKALRATVHDLLRPGTYEFRSATGAVPVRCADIAILVKSNRIGRVIAETLSADGLPVVTLSDQKILHTPEAEELWQILTGIHELSTSSINRAMVTRIAGITAGSLLTIDQESIAERFRRYHDTWKVEGVYVMMQQFMADHDVHRRFYSQAQVAAERTIANMMQLVDLIHTRAASMNLDQSDQLRWLRLAIDGEAAEDDAYIQRLERDEEAIRIVTIHSSKGLEYPIILCPELDFKIHTKTPTVTYRDQNGEFVSGERSFITGHTDKLELAGAQENEEYRRLLYVAITRARQACFIFCGKDPKSTIQTFIAAIGPTETSDYIRLWNPPKLNIVRLRHEGASTEAVYSESKSIEITDRSWRKVSFSRLTPEKETVRRPQAIEDKANEYNDFVFRKLRRGAQIGNLLHAILEAVDFTKPEGWGYVTDRMMGRYLFRSSDEYAKGIVQMLGHLTACRPDPSTGFSLSDVSWQKRLVELEFDLDLKRFDLSGLEALSTPEVPLAASLGKEGNYGLEGILNGFMDLFFEHNGKYYILDWKSNYLGDTLADYAPEKLAEAMAQNNYHLQYMLYTVAACRYLSLRLENFRYEEHFGGVIYLFMRGVRSDGNSGIFYTMPDQRTVEAMEQLFQGEVAMPSA